MTTFGRSWRQRGHCAGLAAGGFLLGAKFERIAGWLGPVGNVVIAAAAAWYVCRVITFRPRPSA